MTASNKNQRVALTAGQGTVARNPTHWVFSPFEGKGKRKTAVAGYMTQAEADEHAAAIGGYVIHLTKEGRR